MHRACEETDILKSEMCNTIAFYMKQFHSLNETVNNIMDAGASLQSFDLGCVYLCGAKLSELKRCIFEHCHSFEPYIVLPTISPEIQAEYECYHLPSPP